MHLHELMCSAHSCESNEIGLRGSVAVPAALRSDTQPLVTPQLSFPLTAFDSIYRRPHHTHITFIVEYVF